MGPVVPGHIRTSSVAKITSPTGTSAPAISALSASNGVNGWRQVPAARRAPVTTPHAKSSSHCGHVTIDTSNLAACHQGSRRSPVRVSPKMLPIATVERRPSPVRAAMHAGLERARRVLEFTRPSLLLFFEQRSCEPLRHDRRSLPTRPRLRNRCCRKRPTPECVSGLWCARAMCTKLNFSEVHN